MKYQVLVISSALFVYIFSGVSVAQEESHPKIDFRQQIQPLLARDCYACHGPDQKHRGADLRLDQEDSAKVYAIVPGDADGSVLIDRIFSDDPEEIMPPAKTDHQLTDDEKQLLKQWINEGADWQKHWAFEPIRSPKIPSAKKDWGKNEIDHFVLRKMTSRKLKPSAPADKATLLRRAYFDLIGLPPTPEQLNAFLKDDSDTAFEKVVDGLMARSNYGEQMAAHWLDAARYADTNGYQNDFGRTMWPWRDWAINSFNENLPYDKFVVQQVAGDMLPNPTPAQMIATGFNRNNRTVTEGGSIEEEWAVENCVDRVEATSGAFLGLTMGCARCHDHKYDPISHEEFYEFFAFFNNVDEQGFYNEARGNVGPTIPVPDTSRSKVSELTDRIKQLTKKVKLENPANEDIAARIERMRGAAQGKGSDPNPKPEFRLSAPKTKLAIAVSPVGVAWDFVGKSDTLIVQPPDFKFDTDVPFAWSAWVSGGARGAIFGQMQDGSSFRGVDGLLLPDGKLKVHLIHQWPSDAIAVVTKLPLPGDGWTSVTVSYDGKGKAAGCHVYFNGQPMEVDVEVDSLAGKIRPSVRFKIGQRDQSSFLKGSLSDFQLFDQSLSAQQVNRLVQDSLIAHVDSLLATDKADGTKSKDIAASLKVSKDYLNLFDLSDDAIQLAKLKSKYDQLMKSQPTTMVMRDREGYRETFLLKRGQYDNPDKEVALFPSIPAALPQLTKNQPRNRLGLAKWMVDDRNPLVARVAVNRAWSQFFGRGLVSPADNFGVQGTPPTHPKLMDWLASDFREHDWDWKRLQKMIVMSATYQQSSNRTAESKTQDPDNIWLARGPRYRLAAEQIRDQALLVSGLLTDQVGGPSVYPYQPDGLWDEMAGGSSNGPYIQSKGKDLYRRSLYTFRKRTVSHPTLATLDAPSWEICQLYRARTNTPLQSLALLNDVTYVEAARKLAERMLIKANPTDTATSVKAASASTSIRTGFSMTHLRQPTESELKTLQDVYQELLEFYLDHPDDAQQLTSIGDSKSEESLAVEKLAAMTSVAAILLNADEVISKE